MRAWLAQLRKGMVEMCVMAALRRSESYGYQILQRLGGAAGLEVTESSVYPILARLATEGFVEVRVSRSPSGPPRRYYRLTPVGRHRLAQMTECWKQLSQAVDGLIWGEKP